MNRNTWIIFTSLLCISPLLAMPLNKPKILPKPSAGSATKLPAQAATAAPQAKTTTTPAPAPTTPKKATLALPTTLKDSTVTSITTKAISGTFPISALGSLYEDVLQKIKTLIKGDITIKDIGQSPLPVEFNPWQAVSLRGDITFLNQPVECTIIIGKLKDFSGKEKLGFSFDLALKQNYTVNQLYKDLDFLSSLGVTANDISKFGTIDLPQPHLIFSTFVSYTNPESKASIKSGLTIATRTKIASFMKQIKQEVNTLTGGNANKLPFLAKVNDDAAVAFDIAIALQGKNFQGFSVNVALPMELGIDMAKMRSQEQSFNPGIKAPFEGLNKPIKEVTSIINKAPLSDIKDISVGNFIASIGIKKNTLELSFGAELNVTTNANVRYGILGTIGFTPEELAIELRKSPSIQSMPLGNGVSIENIALAVFTDFKLLAAGVPISGIGLLGEIKFPFEGDKVTIGLGGQVKATGDFMMMGSIQNLDIKKLAVFNAQLIENLAKAVKFDTGKLTEGMKQLPSIKINDGSIYVATKQITLGGRVFPLGLGVSLDVIIDSQRGKLAVAGNEKELSFLGYLSTIKLPSNGPIVIIGGAGLDKKHGTPDDGPLISFSLSADKPLKTAFDMSGKIEFPPVNVGGQGDVSLGLGRIGAKFSSKISDLFSADFDLQLNIQKVLEAKIAFELNAKERKNFLGVAFKQLEQEIVKAQKGAAKIMLEPLRILAKEIGKGLSSLDIGMPKKIAASLVAKTFSGSMEIDGGSLKLPVIGEIKLGIPKIEFSLKEPMKAFVKIAENWANQIVSDLKKMGKELEKFGKEIEKGIETAVQETEKVAKETGKAIEKGAEEAGKALEKGAKETGKAFEKAGQEIDKFFGKKDRKDKGPVPFKDLLSESDRFDQLGPVKFYQTKGLAGLGLKAIYGNNNPFKDQLLTRIPKELAYITNAIPRIKTLKNKPARFGGINAALYSSSYYNALYLLTSVEKAVNTYNLTQYKQQIQNLKQQLSTLKP